MKIIDYTGCDGVMIGRAAMGNPWIFKNITRGLKGQIYQEPTLNDKALLCKKHFHLLKDAKNETQCVNLSKKHFGYYLKGFNKASEWRVKFMRADNSDEVESLIGDLITYSKQYK